MSEYADKEIEDFFVATNQKTSHKQYEDMIPDYAKMVCIAEQLWAEIKHLQAENKELKAALQSLYDEQSGVPLPRHEQEWIDAMKLAESALFEDK